MTSSKKFSTLCTKFKIQCGRMLRLSSQENPVHTTSATLYSPCDIKYDFSAGQHNNSLSIAGSRLSHFVGTCFNNPLYFTARKLQKSLRTSDFFADDANAAPINSRLNVVVRSPTPFGLGQNGCWPFRGSQLPQELPYIFSLCCPLNDRSRAAHSIYKIGCLFSLFPLSCPTLALLRLLILLLLMKSGNVHPNPGPIFPCSVCAGNVTWRGKSVLCCTCSKWVHLRCSQLSLSKFRALSSSHSWSCLPCRNTVTPSSDSSDTYTSTVQSGPSSTDAALSRHPRLQTSYPPSAHSISPSSAPSPPSLAPGHFSTPPASSPPPDSLRVLQWNAGGLRARSTELLHFLSSHPVDLICIQESNLNSSSSFLISGFSALRSNRTHSRSGILSSDTTHASGGVIIFVRQVLSFSELSTSSLSSLDPYSDYVGVNISLKTPPRCHFLMCTPLNSLLSNGWQNRFLLSLHSSLLQKSLHSGGLQLPSLFLGLKRYFRPPLGGSI